MNLNTQLKIVIRYDFSFQHRHLFNLLILHYSFNSSLLLLEDLLSANSGNGSPMRDIIIKNDQLDYLRS